MSFTGESLNQSPEDLQKFRDGLRAAIEANVAAEVVKEDYHKLGRDAQRKYLLGIIEATHEKERSAFLLEARKRQVEAAEGLLEYQKTLEGRTRQLGPGETLRLGSGEVVPDARVAIVRRVGSKEIAEPQGGYWGSLSLLSKTRALEEEFRQAMQGLRGNTRRQ